MQAYSQRVRHPHDVDLALTVERGSGVPIPVQIADGLRRSVESGVLRPGDPLPSTRGIAARLGVSRGSVVAAFDQLHGEGWLTADRGATRVDPDLAPHLGATVTTRIHPVTEPEPPAPGALDAIDLRPGQPDVSRVVDAAWRAAWRDAANRPWTLHPADGSPRLRAALAEHLRLARGTAPRPDDLVVTAGVRDGFQLLLTALTVARGRTLRVAVEDPGYPALRRVPAALGHTVLATAVDGEGLRVDRLPRAARSVPDVVLVTPGHQYPLGGAMPVRRRLDLIAWAREHDALVVEDDYDGELRYTGEPVPALASLDRRGSAAGDRVITLGSFAKVLAPGLGVGHMLLPQHLRPAVTGLRADLGSPVPATVQDALTAYLEAGALRRHTARMRRVYRARRDRAEELLGGLPSARLRPMDGGLHSVLDLTGPEAGSEEDLVARAADAGVLVTGMAGYWADADGGRRRQVPPGAPRHGLVVGLGSNRLDLGLELLREVLSGGA